MELSSQNIYRAISANLIRFRLEKRYTQSQVAKMLGVSQPTYNRFETCDSPISIHYLNHLSEIYEKPIVDFFGQSSKGQSEFLALQKEHAYLLMKYEQLERTARALLERSLMLEDSSGIKR